MEYMCPFIYALIFYVFASKFFGEVFAAVFFSCFRFSQKSYFKMQ